MFLKRTGAKKKDSLPSKLEKALKGVSLSYEKISEGGSDIKTLTAGGKVQDHLLVRSVLLEDRKGFVLVVLPYKKIIDFSSLQANLQRDFKPAEEETVNRIFSDCDKQTVPPVGSSYGLEVVIHETILHQDYVYFEAGIRGKILGCKGEEFQKLHKKSKPIMFATKVNELDATNPAVEKKCCQETGKKECSPCDCEESSNNQSSIFEKYMPSPDVKKRLDQLYSLPPMPQVAMRILQIKDDPDASVDDLAACVELDPSLAAQVVRYARSPFFGFRGEINNIRDAIHKVLGFNMVTNIAMGLASGKSFKNPADGPLGLNVFWKQATYSAAIVQELGRVLPKDKRPNLGVAYLAALLHNFGFLVLGHMFKPEFFLLNKIVSANPDASVTSLEKQVLGMGDAQHVISMGHARLGAWLMYSWKMPDEVVVTLAEHHNEDYVGVHSVYPNLVLISDRLIKGLGFGDGNGVDLPPKLLSRLGFEQDQVMEVFERVMNGSDSLDTIAKQISE